MSLCQNWAQRPCRTLEFISLLLGEKEGKTVNFKKLLADAGRETAEKPLERDHCPICWGATLENGSAKPTSWIRGQCWETREGVTACKLNITKLVRGDIVRDASPHDVRVEESCC